MASTVNGNPYPANGGHLFHQTNLFRDQLVLKLPILITKRFSDGVEIYNYACSNGAEPYSIAMGLVSRHGLEKTVRSFPIHAIDLSTALIEENKKGLIPLYEEDAKSHPDFTKFFTLPISKRNGVIHYQTTPAMKRLVDFRAANIVEDISNINISQPCVVLFRNAWYHLDLNTAKLLAQTLYQKLPSGSLIVTGSSEDSAVDNGKQGSEFQSNTPNQLLKEVGFQVPADLNPPLQRELGLIFEKL